MKDEVPCSDRSSLSSSRERADRSHLLISSGPGRLRGVAVAACLSVAACATKPLVPYSADTPPLVLATASQAGVQDKRARFREIYCAVLKAREHEVPDHRPCKDALTRVGVEPAGKGEPVDLGPSRRRLVAALVQGLGYGCIANWLAPTGVAKRHVQKHGYDLVSIEVDALSSTTRNARQIRDALMAMPVEPGPPRIVLIGYSKGAPDILEAVVTYPELRSRLAAVVSAAGAVGGSPLANDVEQSHVNLLRHFPGVTCDVGDGGAVKSLRPEIRRTWLAQNPLPRGLPYYSVVAFPQPERISAVLQPSYDKLARVDGRNDAKIIFYDQVIPGSALIAYVNADHWAIAVPIARSHEVIGSLFVTQNAYPREALLEAVLRFIEEDLAIRAR